MHEVSSGARIREPEILYVDEMDGADVHSGKLTLRCKQGHETVVKLPIPVFELLFEFGCLALLDGYTREAIFNFASSLERFEEFACRFLLARRNVSLDSVDAWWKQVAKQSERQRGSYVALWIAEFYVPPPLLPQKLVELRNNCVHKGHIPPEDEAKVYGEAALRKVVEGIVNLRNCFDNEFDYDDFVQYSIIRPDMREPDVPSPLHNTLLSGMWRSNELPMYEDELDEDGVKTGEVIDRSDQKLKNPTDPTKLTIDQALRTFSLLRSVGMRRT
jgi:hypothetical protein